MVNQGNVVYSTLRQVAVILKYIILNSMIDTGPVNQGNAVYSTLRQVIVILKHIILNSIIAT